MELTQIETVARQFLEAHGQKAIAEAAQRACAYEQHGDEAQARLWRRIESTLMVMRGPRET